MRARVRGCQPRPSIGAVAARGCRAARRILIDWSMTDVSTAATRIDAAIGRIEAAVRMRAESNDALARRHAELKARMAEAVSALDDVITRGSPR